MAILVAISRVGGKKNWPTLDIEFTSPIRAGSRHASFWQRKPLQDIRDSFKQALSFVRCSDMYDLTAGHMLRAKDIGIDAAVQNQDREQDLFWPLHFLSGKTQKIFVPIQGGRNGYSHRLNQ